MSDRLGEEAIDYHRLAPAGKLAVVATKPLATQRDLSLAYSPGVAAACELIVREPLAAAEVTARSNLVAVVTNGTAVLGLGAIGALAAKPVMEGKAVLFHLRNHRVERGERPTLVADLAVRVVDDQREARGVEHVDGMTPRTCGLDQPLGAVRRGASREEPDATPGQPLTPSRARGPCR